MSVSLYSCSDPAGDEPEPEPEVEEEFHGPIDGVYTAVIIFPSDIVNPNDAISRVVATPDVLPPHAPRYANTIYFASSDYGEEKLETGDTIRFQVLYFDFIHGRPFQYTDLSQYTCKIKPVK